MKTIKSEFEEVQTAKGLQKFPKIIKESSEKRTKIIPPIIPIVESGQCPQPPFNIRIQYNNRTALMKENINLSKIKGTTAKAHLIDSDFKPKREFVNKRFRKVWRWIQLNPNNDENIIFPSNVIVAKITDDDYYVVQGLRRVVALKNSNIHTISAMVIDYRDVYNKILDRRKKIEIQKKQNKSDIIHSNSSLKPVKPRIRPTPILKGQPRK